MYLALLFVFAGSITAAFPAADFASDWHGVAALSIDVAAVSVAAAFVAVADVATVPAVAAAFAPAGVEPALVADAAFVPAAVASTAPAVAAASALAAAVAFPAVAVVAAESNRSYWIAQMNPALISQFATNPIINKPVILWGNISS